MKLKVVQAGDPVLRQASRPLSADEIKSASMQQLIELMRETMRDSPGVGLAAPQIGESLQLAVIEDRVEYMRDLSADQLAQRERSPIEFHVIFNPRVSILVDQSAEFFEGCLSVAGYAALVRRSARIRVDCLNEHAEPVTIEAQGWYARILQHEIDHLNGTMYLDRMETRSFTTTENLNRIWKNQATQKVRSELGLDTEN
ncbi:MAG: peptide deformylase [Blastocatellia bacterium]|nr:peptide deformylase [Blastocatellia bacterium]